MSNAHLGVYLNDHLAGATAALELLEHLEKAHARRPLGRFFADLRADSVQQIDFSIIKGFRITEGVRMTYRCEFFNSTNRAIFNAPDLGPTSSTFGKITSQANTPRRIQMGLRLVF